MGAEKLLVVDDERDIRRLLEIFLNCRDIRFIRRPAERKPWKNWRYSRI